MKGGLALAAGGTLFGGYALAEPFRLRVSRYELRPKFWPQGLRLRAAVIADLHVCDPWMGLARVHQIVARTNALKPDVVLLLGDFIASRRMSRISGLIPYAQPILNGDWANVLKGLEAPLGVHAVLGNHDWWADEEAQTRRSGPTVVGTALQDVGIAVYQNDSVRLETENGAFWLAGLADQWALFPPWRADGQYPPIPYEGLHDLPATLAQVTDDAPVVLMAHEPDIFAEMGDLADRVAVTISGHTHGGQVRLFGYAPVVPSRYGRRFLYGHIVDGDRNLVVSGGLGCSGLPIRFGVPPEIVALDIMGA
ncbi:metallophosphoesterase [Filomicrobium insigne]|uniref:metallophosphoesterase n=1 Tax=Filomicrobium insigne TaxID=418854 RepID=UPI001FCCE2BD|nr:metallophosphoesterase [Filomicrobium insigne]